MNTATMKKEKGRIVNEGMGGFLNPPTHPEHTYSVETDLRRRPENRSRMSLTAALKAEWLTNDTKRAASRLLTQWQRPELESKAVQEWIAHVLGYFNHCYKGDGPEPDCWYASNLTILSGDGTAPRPNEEHAGVHLIQQYYPNYTPTAADFERAYWGKK